MSGFAADLAEMMAAWSKIEAAARAEFPDASEERIYEICKGAMEHSLRMSNASCRGCAS